MDKIQALQSVKKSFLGLPAKSSFDPTEPSTRYKFDYELPLHNMHENAVKIDKKNGNTKWQDAIKDEIE